MSFDGFDDFDTFDAVDTFDTVDGFDILIFARLNFRDFTVLGSSQALNFRKPERFLCRETVRIPNS